MRDLTFFKLFAKHLRQAKESNLFKKMAIIRELNNGACPFDCPTCKLDDGTLDACGNACQSFKNQKSYRDATQYYAVLGGAENPWLIDAMKRLVWKYF